MQKFIIALALVVGVLGSSGCVDFKQQSPRFEIVQCEETDGGGKQNAFPVLLDTSTGETWKFDRGIWLKMFKGERVSTANKTLERKDDAEWKDITPDNLRKMSDEELLRLLGEKRKPLSSF